MNLRPGHIELFVGDTKRARHFYEHVLGFAVVAVQGERGEYVWLSLGNLEFLLRPGRPASTTMSYHQTDVAIVLYTDNLPETADAWRRRGLAFSDDDGPDCRTFTDPDGHWFQLVDPDAHAT